MGTYLANTGRDIEAIPCKHQSDKDDNFRSNSSNLESSENRTQTTKKQHSLDEFFYEH